MRNIRLGFLAAALTAAPLAAQREHTGGETDDATSRAAAQDAWYNETYGVNKAKRGGPWSQQYRRFMLEAAAIERARWGGMIAGSATAPVAGSTWVNLGPTRSDFIRNSTITLNQVDSGRIRNIVIDPANNSRIFVATAGGGVWRTTDAGTNWTPVTEGVGSLACGWLAMDPANANTLYLGLGDPFDGTGVGIIKSVNGGDTWSSPIYLGNSTAIAQVMVSPTNSSIVLVATNQGLYRSTDAGVSYSLVPLATGQAGNPSVWSIAHTGTANFAISLEAAPAAASGTTDGQIWFSANSGASWTRATGFTKSTGVGRATLAAAPTSPATVYAMAAIPNSTATTDLADMFKSTNGGQTWTALNATTKRYSNRNVESSRVNTLLYGQGWYNQLVIVSPTNANTVYFGGALLLARTTDGGGSFSQLTNWLAQYGLPYVHADFHAAAFDSTGKFYVGGDGGLFRSNDGGTTWTSALNTGMVTHLLYSVCSTPANTNMVLGGFQDNGTRVRSGATTTFNQLIGGDGFGCDAHQSNPNLLLGSLYNARVQKSTNGGSTFSQSCSGITECGTSNAPFYTKIARWEGGTDTLFTISNTRVYRSTNYAGTWSALGTSGLPTTSLFLRNVNVATSNASVLGVVANSGRVFLSVNGGANWTTPATLPNNGFSLSYIHFNNFDSNTIYVASVAPDSTKNHLWKSTNFGASWTAIDGAGFPAGVPVNFVRNDPNDSNTLFAGTHLGVYRSTDGGANWARFGSGMPLVSVNDIYISASSALVRAGTYGRGFWELVP